MNELLYHHGVPGQSWGVRNGPPYPLDRKSPKSKKEAKQIKKTFNKLSYRNAKALYNENKTWEKYQKAKPGSLKQDKLYEVGKNYMAESIAIKRLQNDLIVRASEKGYTLQQNPKLVDVGRSTIRKYSGVYLVPKLKVSLEGDTSKNPKETADTFKLGRHK